MILKRNKFVSQWRNFDIKRSYNFKDMDLWHFLIFLDFSKIYFDFYWFYFFIQIAKRGLISVGPAELMFRVDVARGTRADVTWHARPRGRAARAHAAPMWRRGGADAWQGHMSPRGRPGRAMRHEEGASRWRADETKSYDRWMHTT